MLQLSRLEKVRHVGQRLIARCPVCGLSGGDRRGEHLVIFPNGKFGCAAHPGDSEHRRQIFALVGICCDRNPHEERHRRQKRAIEARSNHERAKLRRAVLQKRETIFSAYRWNEDEVCADSPERRIDLHCDPRRFLFKLFPPDAVVWTGDKHHSGTRYANNWRATSAWQHAPIAEIGPMTTAAIWRLGACNRTAANVIAIPYVVLDFDGFDGIKPESPDEIWKNRLDSLSIIRWIRERLLWRLAAIVWTGSKSMHAWFHTPHPKVLQSLRDNAPAFGIDTSLIGHPEHPCRLPGQVHEKTGSVSRVLWLK